MSEPTLTLNKVTICNYLYQLPGSPSTFNVNNETLSKLKISSRIATKLRAKLLLGQFLGKSWVNGTEISKNL
jgi:hypothetical protein